MGHYVELHCHSCYSLLDGASSPADLVRQAANLGMEALALTDHDAVYGVIPFIETAQMYGIHPILGAELTLDSGYHLTLLVANERGWNNLCYLITCARQNASKGEAALPLDELPEHTEGLIALSGCSQGAVSQALLHGKQDEAVAAAQRYREWFGAGSFWIELQHHLLPTDNALNARLVDLAQQLGVGYVATNNVHYAVQEHHRLQDVLVCIRHNTNLDDSHHLRRPNAEYDLKSEGRMIHLFHEYPEAIWNTQVIADQCRFDLHYGLQDLPLFPTPHGFSPERYLRHLCEAALDSRYLQLSAHAQRQLAHELDIIERCGLANYFLIVWDLVRFAREHEILCQGRGSAANSLVAYLLSISPVDPIAHDLVFERFLSDERQVVPDIDIDFQADRREEVIQYVYQRYGPQHTAMACTFITFRSRSALRDVGKALGLPINVIEQAALAVDRGDDIPLTSRLTNQLIDLCEQIDGFPRHLGIHNGGMIIMGTPLSERLPTEPATMPNRTVVQWDKEMLETAGIIKIDILGLRMLSAIAEAVEIIEETIDRKPDLARLTYDDQQLFAQITDADTIGVFQVESRAQAQVLPRLKPRTFNDLIVSISLIRPGPVQGNMVHPYLRRRLAEEPVTYPHPLLKPALKETLGVILFQEQVIKVARDLAGFSAGQGELLRRTLGGKRAEEAIERFHEAFVTGARQKAVPDEIAEAVFDSLRAFGGYSFPKSHAAAFAVLVYQSAWLKHYYPAAFYVALLNNQPMGFWSPAVIVNDARRHGIAVCRVDINRSAGKCAVEDDAIRLGLNYVAGFGEAASRRIEAARETGAFTSLTDFVRRTRLPRKLIENLILAGAMDDWDIPRRKLLWELGQVRESLDELDLQFSVDAVKLPLLSRSEALSIETQILGLSAGDHIMSLYRAQMSEHGILSSRDLIYCRDGERVQVAGLVVMHQAPPTAKGFHFITLEDEFGMMNIIVRPTVYTHYRRVIRSTTLLLIRGEVEREGEVVNVICRTATSFHRVS